MIHRLGIENMLGFLMIVISMAGCKHTQSEKDTQVFRINYSSGNLESTDPAFARNLYNMWTVHMLYNTLTEANASLQVAPSLAKSWTVSEDGLEYIFILRDDVYFQDHPVFPGGKGRKMKAEDVVYSFNRIIDPAVASSGAWIFNDRVATENPFEAINDTLLRIRLQAPFRPLPEILSMPYCSVVPKEVVEKYGKDFGRNPCGTGPFQLKLWDEGNLLILHKNPKYWEKDSAGVLLPYLDAIEVSFIDSKASEFFAFLQGRLDFVNGIDGSFKDLVLYKTGVLKEEFRNRFKLHRSTYLNTEYLGFLIDTTLEKLKHSPIRNKHIRQAINYAIDRKKIAMYLRNGIGTPATSGFIPPGMPGHDSSASFGYDYNPDKALSLLEEAGFPQGKGLPEISILTPDNWSDVVNLIAVQLAACGIKAKVEIIQPNLLRQQMSKSEALVFRAQWIADYPDAETFLAFFYGNFPAPPNYTRFRDPQFDEWYRASMRAPDTLRWDLYRKMDSLVMSHAPVAPLFYDELMHFTANQVVGFGSNPMNLIDLKKVKKLALSTH